MNSLPIINKSYEVYKAIIELNAKLEKRWLHSLELSLKNSLLECLEILVMVKSAPITLKAGSTKGCSKT